MKTNKFILTAGVLALALTGCTDLDTDVDSQYTEYPTSEAAVEAKMANIYFALRDNLGRRYMEAMELSSDEYTSISYSGNWVDRNIYSHAAYHTYAYTDNTIDWMSVLGTSIVNANEVIDADGDVKYVAPARAMRAWFTFIMMDGWGDVPIIDQKYCDANGLDMSARQPRAEVAKYLESELKDIIPDLTTETTGDNYGKPNKYMAEALLAKIYINWPVYTADAVENYDAATATNEKLSDCISICDDIINSNQFALGPAEYRFKFGPTNTELVESGEIKDFIYAMPYHTTDATGMQYGRSHSWKNINYCFPSYYGETLTNSGGAYMAMTPECVDRFCLEGDQRNLCIIGDTVHVYDHTTMLPTSQIATAGVAPDVAPLVLTKDITLVKNAVTGEPEWANVDVGDNFNGWCQGYRSVKWFVWQEQWKNSRNLSNDIPLLRYADVLLTKAEAIVRSNGSNATAVDLFNQIRSYVKAPTFSGTLTLNDIYDERGREFFDENWRRNDMIRFGHYEDEWFPHYKDNPNASFDKTHRIFPIYKDVLDLNPTWEQNAGY